MAESKEVPAWTYEHPGDHPDNKPPVTAVAVPSDEAKEQYEASINAELEKSQTDADAETKDVEPVVRVQLVDPKDERGAKSEKVDYDAKTVDELKDLAKERGIDVAWDARKADLVKALEKQDKKT